MLACLLEGRKQERASKRASGRRQANAQRFASDACLHDFGNQHLIGRDAANGDFHRAKARIGKQRAPAIVIVSRHINVVVGDRVATGAHADQRYSIPINR